MVIAFYVDEMNFRGVALSTYKFAFYNEKILRNSSIIFYKKNNKLNISEVIQKFKLKFKLIGILKFEEINNYKKKFNIDYIYTQKSGEREINWVSDKIKTIVHAVYPQKLSEAHGSKYAFISEWLSEKFGNKKIPYVPYIVENKKIKSNLRKKFKINNKEIVFGCHGGSSSFDLKFVQDTVLAIAKKRKDIFFLFLNISKFASHPQIKFMKGTSNELYKKKFLNTCDAMIYGRSLGESFGLACAEFAILNKKIISYKFNRHKNHKFSLSEKMFIEYSSKKDLFKILSKFKKNELLKNYKNKYLDCTPNKVMKKFKNVFLSNNHFFLKYTYNDWLVNLFGHLTMNYNYLKHKLYHLYYKIIYL